MKCEWTSHATDSDPSSESPRGPRRRSPRSHPGVPATKRYHPPRHNCGLACPCWFEIAQLKLVVKTANERYRLIRAQHRRNRLSRLQLNHSILRIEEWIKSADADFTLYPLPIFRTHVSPSPELSEVTRLDDPELEPDLDTIWYGFGDDVIEDGVRSREPTANPEAMDVDVSEVSESVAEGKGKEKAMESASEEEEEESEEEEEEQEEGSEWGGIPPEDL